METQKQAWCKLCKRHTLHFQEVEKINHVLHALLCLFLCGLWWPIWLLLTLCRTRYPFRCSRCGQVEGELTPKEWAAEKARRTAAIKSRNAKIDQTIRKAYTAVVSLLTKVNAALRGLAGTDDFMYRLYQIFFVVAVVGTGVAAGFFIIDVCVRSMPSFGKKPQQQQAVPLRKPQERDIAAAQKNAVPPVKENELDPDEQPDEWEKDFDRQLQAEDDAEHEVEAEAAVQQAPIRGGAAAADRNRRWFEGGTLHDAGALEWQVATEENKLATCADFFARLWTLEKLSPKISSKISKIDDFRPFAQEMVKAINNATEPLDDPAMNRKVFQNLRVPSTFILITIATGYLKIDPASSDAEFQQILRDILSRRK